MTVHWDSFASPAQIGEIHKLGHEHAWINGETTDELVRWVTHKYPRDLTREEAADLIKKWRGIFPATPFDLDNADGKGKATR
jgi:hypothetical protein